jgi:hypothetical protein
MERMKRKGLVAILDGLLAYTIAFVAVGLLALLMSNSQQADTKSFYTLNVWAEDIADAIGTSMVDPGDYSRNFLSTTDSSIISALNTSLQAIADENELIIDVEGGSLDIEIGNIGDAREVATAKRFLVDVNSTYAANGGVDILTVKIGV